MRESLAIEVARYVEECKRVNVDPDGGLMCALEYGTTVLKPSRLYTESEFYVLMSFLIRVTQLNPELLPFTKIQFYGGKIGV